MTNPAHAATAAQTATPTGAAAFDCQITDLSYATLLTLRGQAKLPSFCAAVQEATGLPLPTAVNGVSRLADRQLDRQLFCHGPDEWAYYQRAADALVMPHLQRLLQDQWHSLVDNSSGFEHVCLQGPDAYALLQTGCPLDLHPTVFHAGQMAQSHFHKANITLFCVTAGSHFEITVRRTFTRYVRDYLQAALG